MEDNMNIQNGHFYFLDNQYFIDFPDKQLMSNKEETNGKPHNRPCFFAFMDKATGLYWMIPLSTQVKKYKAIYWHKINKYGSCDTIVFGVVLGYERVFLIQNMCPISEKYIKNEYIDSTSSLPVRVDGALEAKLIDKAKRILAMQRRGQKLIFPDVFKIEKYITNEIWTKKNTR